MKESRGERREDAADMTRGRCGGRRETEVKEDRGRGGERREKAEKEDETKKWRKTNAVPEDERETRRGEEVNSKSKTLIFKGSCFMSIWTLTASPCYKHIYLYCFGIAVALALGHGH